MNTTPTESPSVPCVEIGMNLIHFCLIPAVLIVALLSFAQTRQRRWAVDRHLPCLEGRFGIVVPLDVMDSLSNRWSYGFAFGAASYIVIMLFSRNLVLFPAPLWAQPFVFLLGAFEVGLVYFPFFACLSTPAKGVGAVLGMLYTLAWLGLMLAAVIHCPELPYFGTYGKLISSWPTILSFVFLLGRFFLILVQAVKVQQQHKVPADGIEHKVQHVKRLLRKPPPAGRDSWFERRVYKWDPHFRFPNRLIGTTIICLTGLYAGALSMYMVGELQFDRFQYLHTWLESLGMAQSILPILEEFNSITHKSWKAASVSACLTSVVYIFHVLACYRKHMKRLWMGQRGFLPEKLCMDINPATSMAAIARYSGCQIAYTIWGYLITHLLHYLVVLIVAYAVIVPILNGQILQKLIDLGHFVLTIAVFVALGCLQVYTVKIFFLQDKLTPMDRHKPLAVQNRRAFNCFSYFFFFYNVMLGLTAFVIRLGFSLAVGVVLLARIDRSIMARGYETRDLSYTWWVGMLFTDLYHGNPTLVCFCNLLRSRTTGPQAGATYQPISITTRDPAVSSRASKRWALAYTLLRNPHLILLRKHFPADSSSESERVGLIRRLITSAQTCSSSTATPGERTPPQQLETHGGSTQWSTMA